MECFILILFFIDSLLLTFLLGQCLYGLCLLILPFRGILQVGVWIDNNSLCVTINSDRVGKEDVDVEKFRTSQPANIFAVVG